MSATGPKQAETAVLGEGQSIYRKKRVDPGQGGWQRFQESEVTWTEGTWTWVKPAGLSWVEGGGSIEEVRVTPDREGAVSGKRGHVDMDTWTQVKPTGLSWVENLYRRSGSDPGQGRWCEEGSSVKRERKRVVVVVVVCVYVPTRAPMPSPFLCSALVPIRPLRFGGSRLHCRTPRRPAWHACRGRGWAR